MLLTKEETEAGELAYFDSSQIVKTLYDFGTQELVIFFKKGGAYSYTPVSDFIYNELLKAESQGKVFDVLIKKNQSIACYKVG